MRTHTCSWTTFLLASAIHLTACVAEDPGAELLASDEAAVTGVPAEPNITVEFVGCSGIAAGYLVTFPSSGATRFDADYRRGSGAWASLSDGSASSARFASSNSVATVTFRARACNAAGCSSFDQSVPFRPRACSGSDPQL